MKGGYCYLASEPHFRHPPAASTEAGSILFNELNGVTKCSQGFFSLKLPCFVSINAIRNVWGMSEQAARTMTDSNKLLKIAFPIADQNDAGFEIERLWAIHLNDDIYTIDNSPYQVYGISVGDRVFAERKNGELVFAGVAERGRHSTYRVKLPVGCDHIYFLRCWKELDQLGCTYEGASGERRLYSIDVPEPERIADVYRVLQEYEDLNVWEFEEAHHYRPDPK